MQRMMPLAAFCLADARRWSTGCSVCPRLLLKTSLTIETFPNALHGSGATVFAINVGFCTSNMFPQESFSQSPLWTHLVFAWLQLLSISLLSKDGSQVPSLWCSPLIDVRRQTSSVELFFFYCKNSDIVMFAALNISSHQQDVFQSVHSPTLGGARGNKCLYGRRHSAHLQVIACSTFTFDCNNSSVCISTFLAPVSSLVTA